MVHFLLSRRERGRNRKREETDWFCPPPPPPTQKNVVEREIETVPKEKEGRKEEWHEN